MSVLPPSLVRALAAEATGTSPSGGGSRRTAPVSLHLPASAATSAAATNTASQDGRFGDATAVNLSLQARRALSQAGKTADTAANPLERAGDSGKAVAAFLDDFFAGATSEEAARLKDRIGALIKRLPGAQVETATLSRRQASTVRRLTGSDSLPQTLTLTGTDHARLRIETRTDGATRTLRVTYAGRELGGIDMSLTRTDPTPGSQDKPQLAASVEQKKISDSGRLARIPLYSQSYSGLL